MKSFSTITTVLSCTMLLFFKCRSVLLTWSVQMIVERCVCGSLGRNSSCLTRSLALSKSVSPPLRFRVIIFIYSRLVYVIIAAVTAVESPSSSSTFSPHAWSCLMFHSPVGLFPTSPVGLRPPSAWAAHQSSCGRARRWRATALVRSVCTRLWLGSCMQRSAPTLAGSTPWISPLSPGW